MLNRAKDLVIRAWIVALATVAAVTALEFGARALLARRGSSVRRSEFFLPGSRRTVPLEYAPVSLWKLVPGNHAGATIGDDGYRLTPGQDSPGPRKQIWVFGGNGVFGLNARVGDAHTLPAALERELARRSGGLKFDVVNFGVPGFDRGNELALLVRKLSRGGKPAAVVFVDGAADIELRAAQGLPHAHFAELAAAADPGYVIAWDRLKQASGLLRLLTGAPAADAMRLVPDGELARDSRAAADSLLQSYDSVDRLSRARGFRFLMVWQPTLLETRKPLTSEERALFERVRARAPAWLAADRIAYVRLRSKLPANYADLSDLFDSEAGQVFAGVAELEPAAHERVAARIADWAESHAWWKGGP